MRLKLVKIVVYTCLLAIATFFILLQIDLARSVGYSEGYDYGVEVAEKRLNGLVELQAQKLKCFEMRNALGPEECIANVLKKSEASGYKDR